jgi:hypothetical protein
MKIQEEETFEVRNSVQVFSLLWKGISKDAVK